MFFDDFNRFKSLKETLTKKFKEKQNQLNQVVTMRDIFVCSNDLAKSFGEGKSHDNSYTAYPSLSRLIDQIEFLATIANIYHEKYYCHQIDGSYVIKENSQNKITRLLTHEFFLSSENPLTTEKFQLLLEAICEIAKNQHENVHLLLASFPLAHEQKTSLANKNILLNVCVYVQCGPEPKLEIFCKGRAAINDLKYTNCKNFLQQSRYDGHFPRISSFIASNKHKTISNNSIFLVEAKGGARYLQTIDICIDHYYNHAKRLFAQFIGSNNLQINNLLPVQVDQILTSNSYRVMSISKIANTVVHIDPNLLKQLKKKKHNNIVDINDLSVAIKNKYDNMHIMKLNGTFKVANPPFGSEFSLVIDEERKLPSYDDSIKHYSEAYNQELINTSVNHLLQSSYKNVNNFADIIDQANLITIALNKLYDELLNACKISYFDMVSELQIYKSKNQAKNIIMQSHQYFLLTSHNEIDLLQRYDYVIEDLCSKLKYIQCDNNSNFINNLITIIGNHTKETQLNARDMLIRLNI